MSTLNQTDQLLCCAYRDCTNAADTHEMIEIYEDSDGKVFVCSHCEGKVEDSSGYCGIMCQLGYGCDETC